MLSFLVLCWAFTIQSDAFDLTILHTNDFHARFEQTSQFSSRCSDADIAVDACFAGVARLFTAVQNIRATTSNVLLLDAGDQFQGTLWFLEYKGLAAAIFMEMLGYDAMALGNHEFDNGAMGLAPFLQNVTFPVLSSNVDASNDPFINGLFMPSTVVQVAGEQIGIVGYTIAETTFLVDPAGIENIIFEDEVLAIQREVNNLIANGVNKIIALGHGGYDLDLRLAQEVTGVDIIVGGHTNSFLFTGQVLPSNEVPVGPYPTVVQKPNGDQMLIVQAYAFGKYLGFLQTSFDINGALVAWSGNPILLDNTVAQDTTVLQQVNTLAQPLSILRQMVIGETYVFLDGVVACRLGECNLGNLICDAMLEESINGPLQPGNPWSDVSLAMNNGGNIRNTIIQGQITMEQVLNTLPFRNTIVLVRLSGQVLLDTLELSASLFSTQNPNGGFLQLSGFQVTYDIMKPTGSRVVSALVRCQNCVTPLFERIDVTRTYNVLVNSFMASGGDGYFMLRDNVLERREIGTLLSDSVTNYIQRRDAVWNGIEGRIVIIDEAPITTSGPVTKMPPEDDNDIEIEQEMDSESEQKWH